MNTQQKHQRIPVFTILLLLACVGMHYLIPNFDKFYFDKYLIAQGEWWRLLSGHFAHIDFNHLLWNCVGLTLLGYLIERHSRIYLLVAMGSGIIAVTILLLSPAILVPAILSPASSIDKYCGLSGVLNSLLIVALWLEWKRTHSILIPLIAFGSCFKIFIEIVMGNSLFTHISWPPYPWSHLAGLIGGGVSLAAIDYWNKKLAEIFYFLKGYNNCLI